MFYKEFLDVLSSIFAVTFGLEWFVIPSLVCQFILLILAPWRKRLRPLILRRVIGAVYLFEAGLATYVVGSIPISDFAKGNGDLAVFWAAFVMLHLGGPNTITGLNHHYNELWLRYVINFLTLCYSFGLGCYKSSLQKSRLLFPTICIFIAAVLRAIEKVMSRYSACFTQFQESTLPKSDPGVDYAELLETCCAFQESKIPVEFEISSPANNDGAITFTDSGSSAPLSTNELSQVQIVKQAYTFFQDFQGLFVNTIFSYDTRNKSREFFLQRKNAKEAFSICEAELNFAFDVFYTKSILFHQLTYKALALNLTPFILQLASLALWIGLVDKNKFSSVHATNYLVGGTLGHEVLSLFMFLTSDWCIAKVIKQKDICNIPCISGVLFSRWSNKIPQLNLLRTSVDNRSFTPVRQKKFPNQLRDFIFDELVIRSRYAEHPKDVEELCSARGLWILTLLSRKYRGIEVDDFKPWITEVEFEDSVTLWHIATTLCYSHDMDEQEATPNSQENVEGYDHRTLSNRIADYLMYLLIKETRLMLPSARIPALVIFNDTIADAKRFIEAELTPQVRPWPLTILSKKDLEERLRKACKKIGEVDTKEVEPRQIMGNGSKSRLFDACLLAKKLQELSVKNINKWEVINRVLAEMLFYSAVHSTSREHVVKLLRGGELLTVVWLLMAHLGLGTRFRHKTGRIHRGARLVLSKHC